MKRITPVLLTAFSVLALSLPLASHADEKDTDGFLIFEATDATQVVIAAPAEVVQAITPAAAAEPTDTTPVEETTANPAQIQAVAVQAPKPKKTVVKKSKKVKKAKKKAQKRNKRAERKKRSTRAKRNQRSKNLKKAKYYKIRKGDTLYNISVKSGVRLSRLVSLNKLYGSKKHKIQAGQSIRLR